MFASRLGIFKASSLCMKVCLFAIVLINGSVYLTFSPEYHRAAERSFTTSPRSTTQKSPGSLDNDSDTYLESGELYADSVLPGGSKSYVIEAPEQSLASFYLQIDTEGARLGVEAKGPVNKTRVAVVWLPPPFIYYVNNRSEVQFLITNPQTYTVNYRFYVDISELLRDSNSKTLPLEGGKAAFHVDLRKDDRLLLKLSPTNQPRLRVWVLVLYHEILPESTYKLHLYRRSLHENLYFPADLGRRYYIIVDSVDYVGDFTLASSTYSPPWNQEWFWLTVLFGFFIIAFSLTDIGKIKKLERTPLFSLVSCYSWLATIGLSVSVAGSFSYGTSIYMLLFDLLILSYGLSHILQIYATHLERKKTTQNCMHCGRGVDLQEVNYCCGRIVRNVSGLWFLLPFSLGLFSFIASYLIFEEVSTTLLGNSFWAGSLGSISGGIIAWRTNRRVYAIRLWKKEPKRYYIPSHIPFVPIGLLVTGMLFSLVTPLSVLFVMEAFLTQHAESFLEAHALWLRIRVASLTLPLNVILGSTIVATLSVFVVAYRIRQILTRNISEETEKNRSVDLDDLGGGHV